MAITDQQRAGGTRDLSEVNGEASHSSVIPVIAEVLNVEKHEVETGRVRITKHVREYEELVDEPLFREDVTIERVQVNRIVDEAPPTRCEDDILFIPLVEEFLAVEKRLLFREELRVSRRRTETHQPQRVMLRKEEVTIERGDDQPEAAAQTI